jgi:hypothetical protein
MVAECVAVILKSFAGHPLPPCLGVSWKPQMSKRTIILFIAEIAAVALLRLTYIVRRDKIFTPRSSKVDKVGGRPVYRQPHVANRHRTPASDAAEKGFTPDFIDGKIRITPDDSPGANSGQS